MKRAVLVDEVGRIVLPKDIRQAIGLSGRTFVQIELLNGVVLISQREGAGCLGQKGKRRVFAGKLPKGWLSGEAVLKVRARRTYSRKRSA